MYNEVAFVRDFISAYPTYNQQKERLPIQICFATYQSSAKAPLGSLVFGRIVKPVLHVPPMIGLGDLERLNFGLSNHQDAGSVLSSKSWSIPLNDSWLMGGIHALLPFYLASPRSKENIVDPQFGFTVTGRELIGLKTFGYELNPNTTLGEVFECKNHVKARGATFRAYEAAYIEAKRKGEWQWIAS